ALSQTVPVSGSCIYEFGFWGIADDSDAVAEIFWLGAECGLLRSDSVPIREIPREPNVLHVSLASAAGSAAAGNRPELYRHRERFTAPSDAVQAEVRFVVPEGVLAGIDRVTLAATNEALNNADLRILEDRSPAGWELESTQPARVRFDPVAEGLRISNLGTDKAELIQTVQAEAERPYRLEFKGRIIDATAIETLPSIELHWFGQDRSALGAPTPMTITPDGLDSASAEGSSPAATLEADIVLVAPPGTTFTVNSVSLRFSSFTPVPLAFIAQAPGELTVTDWRVQFERAEAVKPDEPEQGLCAPTPPGRRPGEASKAGRYCPCCESEQALSVEVTKNARKGRNTVSQRCTVCGAVVMRSEV
ncbi:MAG: hypothetical protein ACU84J_15760, partial [Gammaproteobacteria bacterium]